MAHNEIKRQFLDMKTGEPVFQYPPRYNPEIIKSVMNFAEDDHQKQELELALLSTQFQKDKSLIKEWRKKNVELYGKPTAEEMIMTSGNILKEIVSKEIFNHYVKLWREYIGENMLSNDVTIGKALKHLLKTSGLAKRGWTVKRTNSYQMVRTNHRTKTITYGVSVKARRLSSVRQIAVHEVYGHALRGKNTSSFENEGIATVLEQLTGNCLRPRRSKRYLAAAYAWGVDGKPRTFRETWRKLWPSMPYRTKRKKKSYAYDECVRVFRGGRPDIPGAVYLKDTAYFRANVAVWHVLAKKPLPREEFIDIIEGRRKIL